MKADIILRLQEKDVPAHAPRYTVDINGKPHACTCGNRIFVKPEPEYRPYTYRCVECKQIWVGETEYPPATDEGD